MNDELKHGDAVCHQIAHRGIALFQAQITRVHAVWGHGNKRLSGKFLLAVKGTHRGLLPRLITVKGVDELAVEIGIIQHESAQHLQVLPTKGRTARSHGSLNACRVHGHHIRIAFHHHGLVAFCDIALGQIQTKEHLGLVIQHGLGRIHVLAQLVIIKELARTKANDVAGKILNGPQQPAVKTVNGTAFAHLGNTGRL